MTISYLSSVRTDGRFGTLFGYLQDHKLHAIVVLLMVAYPGLYHLAIPANAGVLTVGEMFLPNMESMTVLLFFALFAMSFDFISGYTGYLSFGHAAFYGIGAYFVLFTVNNALPETLFGIPFLGHVMGPGTHFMIVLVVAAVFAALVAAAIGLVAFRLSGVYFAMITLGVAELLHVVVKNWDAVPTEDPRNGVAAPSLIDGEVMTFNIGIPGIDALNVAIGKPLQLVTDGTGEVVLPNGTVLSNSVVTFYAIGLVVLLCYFLMQRIINSPFGAVMVAIRENEERARAIGYNTFWYKLAAFSISAFFAGVAGALSAAYRYAASPDSFGLLTTADALITSLLGGFGTLAGPFYGKLFESTVQEFLSKETSGGGLLPFLRQNLSEGLLNTEIAFGMTVNSTVDAFLNGHAPLYVGIVFVLFVLYVPGGFLGLVRQTDSRLLVSRLSEKLKELRQ